MLFFILIISCKKNLVTEPINDISDNNNNVLEGTLKVNPYGFTPLSALYKTTTFNQVPLTVTVKGLYGEEDISHTYPVGYGTEFEIHGLYPNANNTIIISSGNNSITKQVDIPSITLDGRIIPDKFTVSVYNLEEEYPNNPNMYFISLLPKNGLRGIIGISKKGYLRYAYDRKGHLSRVQVYNNKILLYTTSGNGEDKVGMKNLLGQSIIDLTTSSHHDFIKYKNNYLYMSHSKWGDEDTITEVNQNGKIVVVKRIADLIKNIVTTDEEQSILNKIVFDENNKYTDSSGLEKTVDWFHGNSIVYDDSTDILYISSRHRGVIAVKYSEWKLLWWMADETISTMVNINVSNGVIPYNMHFKDLKSLEPYRVKGEAINDGPKNQHALFLLENGNIAMFDNQGDESSNPLGSRYVEYRITGTHGNYAATKVDEYRNSSLYSRITSDIDYTGKNYENILLTYGHNSGVILEINKNSKQELFKINIGPNYFLYRSDKMPFYYEEGRVYSEDANLKNKN